jgi:hypothetical protein
MNPFSNQLRKHNDLCQRQISELLSQVSNSMITQIDTRLFLADQYQIYKHLVQQLAEEEV